VDNISESQRQGHFVFFASAGPADFQPREQFVYQRQPAIFCSDQAVHADATLFLAETVVATGSMATWRTYAYALVSWLDFLWLNLRRDYREACQDDLLAYRKFYSRLVSPYTDEHYSSKTTSLRMTVAIGFYQWLHKRGGYYGDILDGSLTRRGRRRPPIDSDMLAHMRSGEPRPGGYAIVPKVQKDKPIRPLTPDEIRRLAAAAGPEPGRDRVIVDTGWATGLRVAEAASLDVRAFETLDTKGDVEDLKYIMVRGKGKRGGKLRRVGFPIWLIREIQAYINSERRFCIESSKASRTAETALFLTGLNSRNPGPGKRLSVRAIQDITNRISVAAELVIEGPTKEDGKTLVAARVSYHDLRHTYSVLTLTAYRLQGQEKSGLIHVKQQLGHTSVKTTELTYLAESVIWAAACGMRSISCLDILGGVR